MSLINERCVSRRYDHQADMAWIHNIVLVNLAMWDNYHIINVNQSRLQGTWGLHGANRGPVAPGGPHVGPMNLAIRERADHQTTGHWT